MNRAALRLAAAALRVLSAHAAEYPAEFASLLSNASEEFGNWLAFVAREERLRDERMARAERARVAAVDAERKRGAK